MPNPYGEPLANISRLCLINILEGREAIILKLEIEFVTSLE